MKGMMMAVRVALTLSREVLCIPVTHIRSRFFFILSGKLLLTQLKAALAQILRRQLIHVHTKKYYWH